MRVLHSSDLHGVRSRSYQLFWQLAGRYDVWIDTGDMFPNVSRGDVDREVVYQLGYVCSVVDEMVAALDGRPLISVGGNHDYISLAEAIRKAGGTAYDVSEGPVTIGGKVFAGFPPAPWLAGEWNREVHSFSDIIAELERQRPDVLLTHSPPAGILDGTKKGEHCGITALAGFLAYGDHQITTHCFGHVHTQGQRVLRQGGICFSNAANGFNHLIL